MIISVLDRVENIVWKRRNCDFPQCFQKASFQDASNGVIVWECVKEKQDGVFVLLIFCCRLLKHPDFIEPFQKEPHWITRRRLGKQLH